ncbi:MAG: GIY-YIG nuclease family protein [Armatimonadetes bacterium]|nr:GIY-YIG nuclease family protein [Armatimonadota bacterium]
MEVPHDDSAPDLRKSVPIAIGKVTGSNPVISTNPLAAMWVVYILRSDVTGRFNVGSTKDLERRLAEHNNGHTPSTRAFRPWKVVYQESHLDRSAARRRERQIKAWKSHTMIQRLICERASR